MIRQWRVCVREKRTSFVLLLCLQRIHFGAISANSQKKRREEKRKERLGRGVMFAYPSFPGAEFSFFFHFSRWVEMIVVVGRACVEMMMLSVLMSAPRLLMY